MGVRILKVGDTIDKNCLAAITIIALVTLEGIALIMGIDGVMFAPIIALIGAISGAIFGFSTNLLKNSTNKE